MDQWRWLRHEFYQALGLQFLCNDRERGKWQQRFLVKNNLGFELSSLKFQKSQMHGSCQVLFFYVSTQKCPYQTPNSYIFTMHYYFSQKLPSTNIWPLDTPRNQEATFSKMSGAYILMIFLNLVKLVMFWHGTTTYINSFDMCLHLSSKQFQEFHGCPTHRILTWNLSNHTPLTHRFCSMKCNQINPRVEFKLALI